MKNLTEMETSVREEIKEQAHDYIHTLPWWNFREKHFWKKQYISMCNKIQREFDNKGE